MECEEEEDIDESSDDISRPVTKSLFPNVPPYLLFSDTKEDSSQPVPGLCLSWQATTGMPQAVVDCVRQAGFVITQVLYIKKSAHLYLLV